MTENEKRNEILHRLLNKPKGPHNINLFNDIIGESNRYKILSPLFHKGYIRQVEPNYKQEGQTFVEIRDKGKQFIINGGYGAKANNFWTKNGYRNLKMAGKILVFLIGTSLTIIIYWKQIKETLGIP